MKPTLFTRHAGSAWVIAAGTCALLTMPLLAFAQTEDDGPFSKTSYGFVYGEAAGPSAYNSENGTTAAISKSYSPPDSGTSGYASAAISAVPLGTGELAPDLHAVANVSAGPAFAALGAFGQAEFDDTFVFRPDQAHSMDNINFTLDYFVSGSTSGANATGLLSVQWGNAMMSFSLGSGPQGFQFMVSTGDLTYHDDLLYDTYTGPVSETLMASVNNAAGAASADYGDTVKLGEIEAHDANGNPVAGQFYDTYNDGTTGPISFPSNTNFLVPEPSTWVLLAVGAGLLGLTLRRQRRTA